MNSIRKKRQFSIRTALFTTALSFCIIPLVLFTTFYVIQSVWTEKADFTTNATQLNQIAIHTINSKINTYITTLDAIIAHDHFDESKDPNYSQLREKLKAHTASDPCLLNIYFTSMEGDFIQALDESLPEDIIITELAWFKNTIANPSTIAYETPYFDTLTGTTAFTIYKAVMKNNNCLGVLAVDVNLSILAQQFTSLSYGEGGELIAVATDGSVFISPNPDMISTFEPTQYSTWDEILNTSSGVTEFSHNGANYTAIYHTDELTGWKYIFRIPTKELYSAAANSILVSAIIIIIVVILCTIVLLLICNKVYQSLGIITKHIAQNAKGHFNKPLILDTFILEFDSLAENLNTMQSSVSHLLKNFTDSIENVASHTIRSLDESKLVATSMEQINSTVKEIAQGTTESSSNLESISNHMFDLSSNMDELKLATENVNSLAAKTSELGQSGNMISEAVKLTSNQTKASTLELRDAITEVAQKIESISIMSSTISSITEQTNLLALNASIEAARAGEAGKGFAVVASEISKLADETAISALKINDIVKTIEHFVNQAVSKVSETTYIVDSQEEAIGQSQIIFTDIITSVNSLSEKVSDIANELVGINRMKDDVLEKVENLSSILEETAAGTEEVASSTTIVQDSSANFVHTLEQLSHDSESLREQINTFKF